MKNTEAYYLNPIIGPDELALILKNTQRRNFNPGDKLIETVDENSFKTLSDNGFNINLHIHTNASDGKMSPYDLNRGRITWRAK